MQSFPPCQAVIMNGGFAHHRFITHPPTHHAVSFRHRSSTGLLYISRPRLRADFSISIFQFPSCCVASSAHTIPLRSLRSAISTRDLITSRRDVVYRNPNKRYPNTSQVACAGLWTKESRRCNGAQIQLCTSGSKTNCHVVLRKNGGTGGRGGKTTETHQKIAYGVNPFLKNRFTA